MPKEIGDHLMSFPDKKISALNAGALQFDCRQEIVTLDRDRVHIRGKSLRLLYVLMVHSQTVLTKEQLIEKVWDGRAVSDSVLTTAMKELRKALKDTAKNPHYIQTLHGRGYRFLQPVQTVRSAEKKVSADAQEGVFPTAPVQKSKIQIFGLVFLAVFTIAFLAWFFLDDKNQENLSTPSIAVLPFVNMSDDPSNEYFSDGISEELLNLLTRIPELRVISRSSAFSYKGKDINIPTVAEQLNVTHVLEGSVRKEGNQVRITAQLIEARTDTHLWSGSYERTLNDIFATQDEIAARVVEQLKLKLLTSASAARKANPEAFALLLQARHLRMQASADSYAQAVVLLQRALDIDPEYAPAWNLLASTYSNQTNIGQLPRDEGYAMAREAAEKALAVDPGYGPAHDLMGWIAMNYDQDLAAAARHMQLAMELDPRNTAIMSTAATLLAFLGRHDEAVVLNEYVVSRNPVDAVSHMNLGVHYLRANRFEDALDAIQTALRLSPDYNGAHYRIGLALLFKGEAKAAMEAFAEESDEEYRVKGLALASHALGRQTDFQARLTELIDGWGKRWPAEIAHVYAWTGNTEAAIAWLEKEFENNSSIAPNADGPYFYLPLNGNHRYLQLLEQSGNLPAQLDAIGFTVTLPE